MTRVFKAGAVAEVGALHGEGPIWDAAGHSLVWVDIGAGRLHRFNPATRANQTISVGSALGAVAPRSRGGFVLAVEEGFALLDAADSQPRLLARVDHGPGPATRMNDGKCDARGRFWAGTMAYNCAPGHGALYRLDVDLRVTRVIEGITISNGLDWTDDGSTMYFIDSLAGGSFRDLTSGSVRLGVDAFSMDLDTGTLSGRRRLFDVPVDRNADSGMTLPDGMTLDADGFLWVAVHGSGQVRRYSTNGSVEAVVELPVACPTSVAFGGDDLGDLYITSMTPLGEPGPDPRIPNPMWQPRPLEGALFHCRPGVRGRAPNVFAG